MNITLGQLRSAVRHCTPGAPDSYAERLWDALQQEQAQDDQDKLRGVQIGDFNQQSNTFR